MKVTFGLVESLPSKKESASLPPLLQGEGIRTIHGRPGRPCDLAYLLQTFGGRVANTIATVKYALEISFATGSGKERHQIVFVTSKAIYGCPVGSTLEFLDADKNYLPQGVMGGLAHYDGISFRRETSGDFCRWADVTGLRVQRVHARVHPDFFVNYSSGNEPPNWNDIFVLDGPSSERQDSSNGLPAWVTPKDPMTEHREWQKAIARAEGRDSGLPDWVTPKDPMTEHREWQKAIARAEGRDSGLPDWVAPRAPIYSGDEMIAEAKAREAFLAATRSPPQPIPDDWPAIFTPPTQDNSAMENYLLGLWRKKP